jgi:hypothetical protein
VDFFSADGDLYDIVVKRVCFVGRSDLYLVVIPIGCHPDDHVYIRSPKNVREEIPCQAEEPLFGAGWYLRIGECSRYDPDYLVLRFSDDGRCPDIGNYVFPVQYLLGIGCIRLIGCSRQYLFIPGCNY